MNPANPSLRAWEAVLGSLNEVDALYEFAPVGLCVFDTELRFLRVNRRLAEMNGLSVEAHLGRTVEEIVPSVAPMARDIRDRIIATGAPVHNVELTGETPAAPGRQGVWREQWWPIKDRLGQVAAINVAVEDVTAEKQLVEAQRAADRVKDDFLSAVSHELRGPLNVIRGWTQMLCTGGVEADRYRDVFDRIDRAASTQQRLVEDLLDVTRLTTGKLTMRFERVPLQPAITLACDAVRHLVASKPVRLSVHVDGEGVAWGDAARIQQIVTNLVENAAKFTAVGTIEIRAEDADRFVRLTIHDTGEGFDPLDAERIFERFNQSRTTRSADTGVGLGLFIVRELAHLHGGRVQAHSAGKGQGTTLTVTLPRLAP